MNGDDLTPALLLEVRRRTRHAVPWLDADVIDTAVDDALLKYVRSPGLYSPDRGGLSTWLTRVAENLAKDEHRRVVRRAGHEVAVGVDLPRLALIGATDEAEQSRKLLRLEQRRRLLNVAWTPRERAFVRARLDDGSVEAQAEALGVAALPLEEQREEIHRTMARLYQRARGKRP